MIAALFVQTGGVYFNDPRFDPWDEARDARAYAGPWPVIAHPPCQRWGRLGHINWIRWGGEHNRPGNDGGCFAAALYAVRNFGGVIEHPARSRAWDQFGLVKPKRGEWTPDVWPQYTADQPTIICGWSCEVWQSAYGHRAAKATWLYFVGPAKPQDLDWSRPRGTHQVGYWDRRGKEKNKPMLSKHEANATPLAFREALYSLVEGMSHAET